MTKVGVPFASRSTTTAWDALTSLICGETKDAALQSVFFETPIPASSVSSETDKFSVPQRPLRRVSAAAAAAAEKRARLASARVAPPAARRVADENNRRVQLFRELGGAFYQKSLVRRVT